MELAQPEPSENQAAQRRASFQKSKESAEPMGLYPALAVKADEQWSLSELSSVLPSFLSQDCPLAFPWSSPPLVLE
jgi:hypothetical protein